MENFGEDLRNWQVHPSGLTVYEARNGYEAYGVDLESHICTCRLWDISGIPCVHAQASILYSGQDPMDFISMWFGVDKFKATYATNLLPVNGSTMWPRTQYNKPLPPLARRMPGRPSVKRKRHISEHSDKYHSVSGKGRAITCTNCLQKGHNKVSCKNETVTPDPPPKKKIRRPRVEPDISHWTRGRGRGVRRGARGGGTSFVQRGTGNRGGGTGSGRGGRSSRGRGTGSRGGGTRGRGRGTGCRAGGTSSGSKKVENSGNGLGGEVDIKGKKVVEQQEEEKKDGTNHLAGGTGDVEIKRQIDSLRYSQYSTEEIKRALHITDEELERLDNINVPPEHEDVQMSLDFDPFDVPIEVVTQDDEEVDDTQHLHVETQKQVPKTRRPSERILKQKLKKSLGGVGGSEAAAIDLE